MQGELQRISESQKLLVHGNNWTKCQFSSVRSDCKIRFVCVLDSGVWEREIKSTRGRMNDHVWLVQEA